MSYATITGACIGGGWRPVASAVFKTVVGPVWSGVGSTPIRPRKGKEPPLGEGAPAWHFLFFLGDLMADNIMMTDVTDSLRPVVAEVMAIEDVTAGRNEKYTARFRGQLRIDSVEAYERVSKVFAQYDHTPLFRTEEGRHVILAMPGVINPSPSNPWINLVLMALTVFSAFFTGALYGYQGPETDFGRIMLVGLRQIYTGWPFAVGLLSILLAHEFGHYIAARRHGAPVTLPYFIPMPYPISPFGTLGAVILMKAPIRNRRILLDIGIAGPLAGFIVAVPVLLIGLMRSQVEMIPLTFPPGQGISLEGNSIVYLIMK